MQLKSTLNNFKTAQTDPANYIFEYFSDLRSKIDLRKEEIKLNLLTITFAN